MRSPGRAQRLMCYERFDVFMNRHFACPWVPAPRPRPSPDRRYGKTPDPLTPDSTANCDFMANPASWCWSVALILPGCVAVLSLSQTIQRGAHRCGVVCKIVVHGDFARIGVLTLLRTSMRRLTFSNRANAAQASAGRTPTCCAAAMAARALS